MIFQRKGSGVSWLLVGLFSLLVGKIPQKERWYQSAYII